MGSLFGAVNLARRRIRTSLPTILDETQTAGVPRRLRASEFGALPGARAAPTEGIDPRHPQLAHAEEQVGGQGDLQRLVALLHDNVQGAGHGFRIELALVVGQIEPHRSRGSLRTGNLET